MALAFWDLRALIIGVLLASSVTARAAESSPEVERGRSVVTHRASISTELAVDTNARRQQTGGEVGADVLGYLFATGRIESRRPGRLLSAEANAGVKRFLQTRAEDTALGHVAMRYASSPRQGLFLGADVSYRDRLQRGDRWDDVKEDEHLACRPPRGTAADDYRCNRRDYRQGSLAGSLEMRRDAWWVRGRFGSSALDYKPNRQFSYAGPDAALSFGRALGEQHSVHAHAGASLRRYHPGSAVYRFSEIGDEPSLQVVSGASRVEHLLSGGVGWRYRGPFLLSAGVTIASGHNNSAGMDVLRGRAELAGAVRLTGSTTLVAGATFQLGHYPDGNVFRGVYMPADEEERQSSLGIQATQRLTDSLAFVFKAQAFANELSGDAILFRRQVVHAGMRWSM